MVVLTFQQKDPKKGFGIASVGQAKGITRFLVGEKGKGASGFLRFFFSANSFHQYQLSTKDYQQFITKRMEEAGGAYLNDTPR